MKSEICLLCTLLKLRKGLANRKLKSLLQVLLFCHLSIAYIEDISLPLCSTDTRQSINSFSDFECESKFPFTKPDLKRLRQHLKCTGEEFSMDNKSTFSGENIFLGGLYELCSGASQTLGRDKSAQSRASSKGTPILPVGMKTFSDLKYQVVDKSYGFTEDLFFALPKNLRYTDLTLLRLSNVNARFHEILKFFKDQYYIFGDSACIRLSHL